MCYCPASGQDNNCWARSGPSSFCPDPGVGSGMSRHDLRKGIDPLDVCFCDARSPDYQAARNPYVLYAMHPVMMASLLRLCGPVSLMIAH